MLVKFSVHTEDIPYIKNICYWDAEYTDESCIARLVAIHPERPDSKLRDVEVDVKNMEMFLGDLFLQGKRKGAGIEPIPKNNPLPF